MEIYALKSSEEVPLLDHVVVVKLGNERFEVSGTAGCERVAATSTFLQPVLFREKTDALRRAAEFAEAHSLHAIYIKGFRPPPS